MTAPSITTDSKKRSRTNLSRSFLNTTNPEIFTRNPRAGGYIKIRPPNRKKCIELDDDQDNESVMTGMTTKEKREMEKAEKFLREKMSREFRINKTLFDTTWTCSTLFSSEESDTTIEIPTPLEDSIDMLAVALSTVMLLAKGVSSVPATHIEWTNSYFGTIKDDFGHTPPNLQGILNHIGYLQENGLLGTGDEAKINGGTKRGSKTVRTTTTIRRKSDSDANAKKDAPRRDIGPPIIGQPRPWMIGDPVPEDETEEEKEARLALIAGFTEDDTSAAIT